MSDRQLLAPHQRARLADAFRRTCQAQGFSFPFMDELTAAFLDECEWIVKHEALIQMVLAGSDAALPGMRPCPEHGFDPDFVFFTNEEGRAYLDQLERNARSQSSRQLGLN